MILNYIKIALRFFKHNLIYSLINLIGLTFGLTCSIICLLHINYEFSFDMFHSNYKNIYRLVDGNPNDKEYWAKMSAPLPVVLKENFPEVIEYVRVARFSYSPEVVVKSGNSSFLENNILLVDPSFLKVFDFKLTQGDVNKVLSSPQSALITQSNVKKYFGNENTLGKVININDRFNYTITGIIEDAPFNSHLEFDFLISFENLNEIYGEGHLTSWGQLNWWAYVLLADNKRNNFESSITNFLRKEHDVNSNVYLQPLKDIHFQGNRGNQKASYSMVYIYVFSAIAISVLFIACINFINFINALSGKRLKEVSLRKTFGANRSNIILQFITESVIMSLTALMIAFVIVYYVLPVFNSILNNNITLGFINQRHILITGLLAVLVGIISGAYISFYMASFSITNILKGITTKSYQNLTFSHILIIAQFAISSILIIFSTQIFKQLAYIGKMDVGFNKESVVSMPIYGKQLGNKIEVFKKEVAQISTVINVSTSRFIPGFPNENTTLNWQGKPEGRFWFYRIHSDADFLETMDFEFIEGSIDELKQLPEGEVRYIVNEKVLKITGWDTGYKKFLDDVEIGGVIKNFNFQSVHKDIAPLVIKVINKRNYNQVFIRISPNNTSETISKIKGRFNQIFPDIPFEYNFLDDQLRRLYKAEYNASKVVNFISLISILIALFGVFALISLKVKERTKEIAIRKVLGVSLKSLFYLLTKSFNKLLLLGCLISWPIAFYIIRSWLRNFSYKIPISFIDFALTALAILLVIQIVISTQIMRVYRSNLASKLRHE
ncbi:MAG: hypothetical protein C0597_04740 [Marinilabiliales bacterium]|nr:MAG: hypothetical protein C0597_04740 [Marinilabiliales bacterium]